MCGESQSQLVSERGRTSDNFRLYGTEKKGAGGGHIVTHDDTVS